MNPKLDPTLDFPASLESAALALANRREFIQRLGGGIAVFVAFGGWASAAEAVSEAARPVTFRPELPTDFD